MVYEFLYQNRDEESNTDMSAIQYSRHSPTEYVKILVFEFWGCMCTHDTPSGSTRAPQVNVLFIQIKKLESVLLQRNKQKKKSCKIWTKDRILEVKGTTQLTENYNIAA